MNYTKENITIEMSVKASVPDGTYLIQWEKRESNKDSQEYLNILNQILSVYADQKTIFKPTFDIEDFRYVYEGSDVPTTVYLELSQSPSDSVVVIVKSDNEDIVSLVPSIIRFDRTT